MIELTSPAEIIALKLQWHNGQKPRHTKPIYEYTEERKSTLQLIAENYKKSEEKRIAKRGSRKKAEEKAENERWDKIWKEKFEDKSYYAR